jgi:transposase
VTVERSSLKKNTTTRYRCDDDSRRWPAIEVFLTTGLTNARTEGTNRLIKQVKRAACGFRNRDNYRRRVRLHCTRQTRRLSARNPTVPA